MFSSMPFFWIGGLDHRLFQVLHVGATLVTQSSFEPGAALDLIEQERATIVTGWPQQGKTMSRAPVVHAGARRDASCARAWPTSCRPSTDRPRSTPRRWA